MDPGVRHQVGLEFSQINIQGTIETERSSDGGDNLTNEPVEVGVGWSLDVKVPTADVIDGFIVNLNSAHRPNESVDRFEYMTSVCGMGIYQNLP